MRFCFVCPNRAPNKKTDTWFDMWNGIAKTLGA